MAVEATDFASRGRLEDTQRLHPRQPGRKVFPVGREASMRGGIIQISRGSRDLALLPFSPVPEYDFFIYPPGQDLAVGREVRMNTSGERRVRSAEGLDLLAGIGGPEDEISVHVPGQR